MNAKAHLFSRSVVATWLVVVVLTGAVGWLVWQVGAEVGATRQLRDEQGQLTARLGRAESNRRLLADYQTEANLLADYFVSVETLPEVLAELERLAAAAGIGFELTQAEVGEDETATVQLGFAVAGDYAAVFRFVELLERLPHASEFLAVELHAAAAAPGASPSGRWYGSFNLELAGYESEN